MTDNIKKLEPKHYRAIALLLEKPSIKDAAKAGGIGYTTLRDWLKDDTFKAELAEAEALAVSSTARAIAEGGREAVAELRKILNNRKSSKREKIAAANSLLRNQPTIRLLGSLEQAIEELKRGNNDNT